MTRLQYFFGFGSDKIRLSWARTFCGSAFAASASVARSTSCGASFELALGNLLCSNSDDLLKSAAWCKPLVEHKLVYVVMVFSCVSTVVSCIFMSCNFSPPPLWWWSNYEYRDLLASRWTLECNVCSYGTATATTTTATTDSSLLIFV